MIPVPHPCWPSHRGIGQTSAHGKSVLVGNLRFLSSDDPDPGRPPGPAEPPVPRRRPNVAPRGAGPPPAGRGRSPGEDGRPRVRPPVRVVTAAVGPRRRHRVKAPVPPGRRGSPGAFGRVPVEPAGVALPVAGRNASTGHVDGRLSTRTADRPPLVERSSPAAGEAATVPARGRRGRRGPRYTRPLTAAAVTSAKWQATGWPVPRLDQRGLLLGAEVLRLPAPGAEAAARRRVDRARHVALEHDALAGPLARGVGHRHRRQQRLRVRVRRAPVDRLAVPDLDDLAEVHHRDPVARCGAPPTGRGR